MNEYSMTVQHPHPPGLYPDQNPREEGGGGGVGGGGGRCRVLFYKHICDYFKY